MPNATRDELKATFSEFVRSADIIVFPVHWHLVNERRGTVVAQFGNRL